MSNLFKEKFGNAPAPLPLGKAGNILCANSLRVDWREVMPKEDSHGNPYEVYLFGNPPFLGKNSRSMSQSEDIERNLSFFQNKGSLDYICCFFWKGAQYIAGSGALAFVSTNSICQGSQAATLWQPIFNLGVDINFAYQSFPWTNNAKQQAGVHVVIVGLSNHQKPKNIYNNVDGVAQRTTVKNISPYLTNGNNLAVSASRFPLCATRAIETANMPLDGGNLLLNYDERTQLIDLDSRYEGLIKRYMGSTEFLGGNLRYCLWLGSVAHKDLSELPLIKSRLKAVYDFRFSSNRSATKDQAKNPHLFAAINQPTTNYLVIPVTSSERRDYVPIGFMTPDVIASSAVNIIPNATFYEFGVLTSIMHNTWLAAVCGRLESRYRYSATIVYNTFPWAETTQTQRDRIEVLAKEVLLVREDYVGKSLAELYDPNKMPATLRAAHKALDLAVDKLYRDAPFRDNTERLEHLFARYEKLIAKEAKA